MYPNANHQDGMEGHFQTIPPMGSYYNGQPMMPPEAFQPRMQQLQTMSSETLNSYSDIEDPSQIALPAQGSSRPRRRQSGDHIKHRRTRSGCYTCRQRRVKCDEAHPVCERCRKGKRECVYPEPATSSKNPRSNSKKKSVSGDSGSNSSEDDEDDNELYRLPSIPDDEDATASTTTAPTSVCESIPSGSGSRHSSNASGIVKDNSPISPKDASTGFPKPQHRPQVPRVSSKQTLKSKGISNSKWATLPKDVRFYMNYHKNHLSHHHYAMKYDTGDFLKTTFLEIALGYEPLLYAVTGFAAYHHTLTVPNGKIQHFLGYYNKSVSLLRVSLERSPKHSVATLLTILQLATFEEFLGDWVNLMGHQKAAYEILTELFTPQTIMQSETHRKIITWYIRFDLFAGYLSGYETVLGREWFSACTDFYTRQARGRPNDLGCILEENSAKGRLLATDISILFARKGKGAVSDADFAVETNNIRQRILEMAHVVETTFADRKKTIKMFPNAPTEPYDSIVDSTDPDFLYADELYTWNFTQIDFWSIQLMFESQMCVAQRQPPSPDVINIAYRQCKMFEALQFSSTDPKPAILGAQASLGMASLYLPRDQRHTMWTRRKYALIESCGYIYPAALRKKMSDMWNEDVTRWWLPNDEDFPPIIQEIRQFIEFRAQIPKDTVSEDLRDMRGLFNTLSMEDSDTPRSRGTDSDLVDFNADGSVQWESSPDLNHWS